MPNELHLLKKRTIKILNTFRKLCPESLIFKDVTIVFINQIDEDATSGFHELYLKCQLFQHLASNLSDANYEALPIKARYLVEMLFNPGLEHDLLKNCELKSLDDMLFKYSYLTLNPARCIPFWEGSDYDFGELRKTISQYIHWYEIKNKSLYKNLFPPILPDPNQNIISQMDDANDVDQGQCNLVELAKHNHLGTTGLACCIALIGIQDSATPIVGVCHAFCNFESTLEDICNENFKAPRKDISIYLIGGYPIHFADYLPIIYKNEFNIIDVRLATSVNYSTACVVTSDGKNISIHYSGNLSHIATKKRPLEEEKEDSVKMKKARLDSEPSKPSL